MSDVLTKPARRLPAGRDICVRCGRPIVWARTVAGPNGPGGKSQPFDPFEDLAGNVAVYPGRRGQLFARALFRDEAVDRPIEYSGMPHAATCSGSPLEPARRLPAEVTDLHTIRTWKDQDRS